MPHKKDAPGEGRRIAAICPICYIHHERPWSLEIESWMKSYLQLLTGKKDKCSLSHVGKSGTQEDE